MNILTKIRLINELNLKELKQGVKPENSWHQQYKDSAWVYAGNLAYNLTEGDLITVFSQWGEISNINLVRDKDTGKSKGFCFICYENQRSTILAVDNFNGMELCNRPVRVDHVEEYKVPKIHDDMDEDTKRLKLDGVAPKTPPQTDSEDDLPIEEIREKRKEDSKAKKEKLKEERKKQMKDFQKSLAEFRASCGGYFEDLTPAEEKFMKKEKKSTKKKGLEKRHEKEDEVFGAFGSFGYKATEPCPW